MPLVSFNPLIGPYQDLPRRAKVDLGAMAMKGSSAFPEALALLEHHHQIKFILDLFIIMLSFRKGGIKYHFFVLGMAQPVIHPQDSRAFGEHFSR